MEFTTPPPEIGEAGLRLLKTVALADGESHALEKEWIESVQALVVETGVDLELLEPMSPK